MAKSTRMARRETPYNRRHLVFLQDRARKGPAEFYLALREVVQSQEGGIAELSRRAGLARTGLYKVLSEKGNPSYATIYQILDALDLNIVISPRASTARKRKMPKAKPKNDIATGEQHKADTTQLTAAV